MQELVIIYQQKIHFITTFALAFSKHVAFTDAHASLGDSHLRSILEATCFSDGYEEKLHAGVFFVLLSQMRLCCISLEQKQNLSLNCHELSLKYIP